MVLVDSKISKICHILNKNIMLLTSQVAVITASPSVWMVAYLVVAFVWFVLLLASCIRCQICDPGMVGTLSL